MLAPETSPRLNPPSALAAKISEEGLESSSVSANDIVRNIAFAGAFALSILANPLPSFADGKC